MQKIFNYIQKNMFNKSTLVNKKTINEFIADPNFPYLISFGRTGSHWLRTVMELYFEKPSLVRAFYYKNAKDFTCFHDHDMSLKTQRKNVIYLYRDPVATVYSQIKYHKLDFNNKLIIKYWTCFYGIHLEKWLVDDDFTIKKTILTYEGMVKDMHSEFKKVCKHFGEKYNKEKLEIVLKKVSKKDLKKRTKHDEQVVNLSSKYQNDRDKFKQNHSDFIYEVLNSLCPELKRVIN